MILDLTQGFGDFPEYKLFKFPDGSIKFELKNIRVDKIVTTLRNSDDILVLGLVGETLKQKSINRPLFIKYLMYQQDDRLFSENESFGLRFLSNYLNSLYFSQIQIFHPHSDKVEFIDNVRIIGNEEFIAWSIKQFQPDNFQSEDKSWQAHWVIPDSGAFKTQFKEIQNFSYPNFITCMKSRSHSTGEIETIVNCEDLQGRDCFIVDDICVGGRTFIQIAEELKKKNCGKLYLIVSHGIFSNGIGCLLPYFETIYTTDSICLPKDSHKIKIYKL